MGVHHGKSGTVKIGSDTIAEITAFSLNEDIDIVDSTVMGDTAKDHENGVPEWDGDLSCFWDEGDTNGQEALTIGAVVALKMYPEGAGTGAKYYYGNATVQKIGIAVVKDGIVTRSFTFKGKAALTLGTAS